MKTQEHYSEDDSFDVEEACRWNAYCSMKEALTQEAYIKSFGNGDFKSFNEAIDNMNLGAVWKSQSTKY